MVRGAKHSAHNPKTSSKTLLIFTASGAKREFGQVTASQREENLDDTDSASDGNEGSSVCQTLHEDDVREVLRLYNVSSQPTGFATCCVQNVQRGPLYFEHSLARAPHDVLYAALSRKLRVTAAQ